MFGEIDLTAGAFAAVCVLSTAYLLRLGTMSFVALAIGSRSTGR